MVTEYEWIFDGGAPSVDFLNTLRDRTRTPTETLHTPQDLQRWLGRAGLLDVTPQSRADQSEASPLEAARALRDAVDAVLVPGRDADSGQIRLINQWARRAPVPQLSTPEPASVEQRAEEVEAALGILASDAIALVAEQASASGLLQIKVCAHTRCGLRYVDRSRGLRRQWCSMRRCGNRAKAARHAASRRRPRREEGSG
ncbi:CGNR zinc finger domain-containing protein [Nesterenkonia aerolata]|uniref:CGNR zinc finger domain-containing protein n=1 Tax=Nesterenkonia aerolata TaxID=3074079 RepID=A0ABU2DV88_9MICC|nr:CGNR zinc finger domain-containing protein [Nesterenkonia sp. LY-0111]MDR8020301.1 CGNR zinc finger domain-containing protein [Nesterenkonia sp. LY-0111]